MIESHEFRINVFETEKYTYDDNDISSIWCYDENTKWMSPKTNKISIVNGIYSKDNQAVVCVVIEYRHKNLYGRSGYYLANKAYWIYVECIFNNKGKILKTMPKEVYHALNYRGK